MKKIKLLKKEGRSSFSKKLYSEVVTHSGITLIALIVTIIVLLILAGIALNFALGSDGILKKATSANDITNQATAKEQVEILLADYQAEYYQKRYEIGTYDGTKGDYISEQLKVGVSTNDYYVRAVEDRIVKVYKGKDNTGEIVATGKLEENGAITWDEEISGGNEENPNEPLVSKNRTLAGTTRSYTYKNPVIPQGFNPVDTDTAKWEYTDANQTEVAGWNNGLVIEDEKENQFVWIPVDGTVVNYTKWSSAGFSYTACTDATDTATIDGVEYKAIPVDENQQIEKYQGFYVARYEAGLETETLNQSAALNNIYTEIPVSKAGSKVWNYIDYTHAYVVAEKMINDITIYGNNKSGLITGMQWDTIMKWYDISQPKIKVDNTIDWGSYYNIAYAVQSGLYFNSDSATSVWTNSKNIINHSNSKGRYYHASGANHEGIKKNIADMAGNFYEWTAEKYTSKCIMRSGQAWHVSSNNYASGRFNDYGSNITSWGVGFRVVLYVQ